MAAPEMTYVDIRLSHLLRDCAVGAIVRHDKALMVVEDTRHWDGPNTHPHHRELRYVDLVKRSLDLDDTKLCRPPVKEQKGRLVRGWVPARRFPEWTRCNRCGLLHNRPWRRVAEDGQSPLVGERDAAGIVGRTKALHCRSPETETGRCGGALEQVPWVLIHEKGYLADAPWHALAHDGARSPAQRGCRSDWATPYIRVVNRAGRWRVRCSRCGAENQLADRFPFGPNTRQQPWIPEPPPEEPQEPGWLVGINDVRVHYAETRTALVIPPESRVRRGGVVDRLYSNSADQDRICDARTDFARQSRVREAARKYRCRPEEVEEALEQIRQGYPHVAALPQGELAQLEYDALIQPIPDLQPDEDFVTKHHTKAWRGLGSENLEESPTGVAAAVDRLVAVHRVKEIMVCDGFRRVVGSGPEKQPPTPPDIVGEGDWLPALELWGEGVFFTLEENLVRRWEAQESLWERVSAFVERAAAARLPLDVRVRVSPRFLLCHTLAHLIIRHLESEAGYPAASLKERIYCSDGEDGDRPMAGVLIHVAVADEHGSLGGLMDMAQPNRFLRLLTGAVDDATWCSFDPVCAEQDGHGPDLLNRAACHACALVPEPSCICGNRLLDRMFVTGDGERFRSLWDMAVKS